jgi:hypothetical protein
MHRVNSLNVSRRATPHALVVASTTEIFVLVHSHEQRPHLAALVAEGDP